MIGNACLIITKPKGEEIATHGIRMAWAMFSSAMEPHVLFVDDGVFNSLTNPGYNTHLMEDYIKEGGVASCYRKDLESRGLTEDQLIEGVNMIDEDQVNNIMDECEGVLTF